MMFHPQSSGSEYVPESSTNLVTLTTIICCLVHRTPIKNPGGQSFEEHIGTYTLAGLEVNL